MHLVDEKQGALPCLAAAPRVLENFFKLGDAGKNRRNLDEGELRLVREKARDGRLAGPRRPPENQAAERARGNEPSQRALGSQKMILTGDIGEALRAQPVGERMRRVLFEIGGGEEIGHLAFKSGPLALRTQAGKRAEAWSN